MRYLTLNEVLQLYRQVIGESGGATGVRDLGALKSALSQPGMSFSGEDLYPTVIDKAAILCFSIVMNHPFVDGNKRTGHAAMEVFLVLNGYEVDATVQRRSEWL